MKHVQSTFSTLFDVQWTLTTLSAVMIAVRLTKTSEIMEYLQSLFYMLIVLAQLAVICWKASVLMDVSTDIGKAAYELDWVNNPKKLKPVVQMIAIRSQNPLKFTAWWGVVTLDLETIINVVKLSYSYFTIIRNLEA